MILTRCQKLRIVLRKNLRIQITNRYYGLYAILTPLIYCLLLIILRLSCNLQAIPAIDKLEMPIAKEWKNLIHEIKRRHKLIQAEKPSFEHNVFVPQLIIAHAPHGQVYDEIIKKTQIILKDVRFSQYSECEDVKTAMRRNNYLAGICFTTDISKPNFFIKIIFPSELRIYNQSYIGSNWKTNLLFDTVGDRGYNSRARDNIYLKEGFLHIQIVLTKVYFELLSIMETVPTVVVMQFPLKNTTYDKLDVVAEEFIPALLTFAYLTLAVYLVNFIVKEKEGDGDHIMRTLSLGTGTRFLAWFLQGFIYFVIASILLVGALKIGGQSALLYNCDYFVVLFVMVAYNAASVSFCYMVSAFFKGPTFGIYGMSVTWFLSHCPRLVHNTNLGSILTISYLEYFFPNTLISAAFDLILIFERLGTLNWRSLNNSTAVDSKITLGIIVLILYGQCVTYAIIGLFFNYIQLKMKGKNRKTLLSIFTCKFWRRKSFRGRTYSRPSMRIPVSGLYELVPEYKTLQVCFDNVTKKFGDVFAVQDLTLNLYDNEIFVIMGHNGCGKTTLLSMLAGVLKPTFGSITIDGVDVVQETAEACSNMGISLQKMGAFEDLTVHDQLVFFSHARGLDRAQTKDEVNYYLEAMEMMSERSRLVKNLSAGRKAQLAVCCALIGSSKLVILDNLGDSFDIRSRKLLWDLLKSQREHRLILMSSHLVYDIEAVADRVAFMSNGRIIALGTPKILKNIYQQGSRLLMHKGKSCKTEAVTELIQKYTPGAMPDYDIGNELSFSVGDKSTASFTDLLNDLEENAYVLDISSISIVDKGLGDLYHQMGSQKADELDFRGGTAYYINRQSYDSRWMDIKYPKRVNFFRNYAYAMYIKFIKYRIRRKFTSIILLFFPPFFIIIINLIAGRPLRRAELQVFNFTLRRYVKSRTLMVTHNLEEESPFDDYYINQKAWADKYRQMISWLPDGHTLIEPEKATTMGELLFDKMHEDGLFAPRYYLIGASFTKNITRAWFHHFGIHTAPLSISQIYNAMVRSHLQDASRITWILEPLPLCTDTKKRLKESTVNLENLNIMFIVACTSLYWSVWTLFLVKEKQSRFKFHQRMAGLPMSVYWFCNLIKELFDVVLTSLIAITAFVCLDYSSGHDVMGWILLLYILGGLAVAAVNNILGVLMKHRHAAYVTSLGLSLFGALAAWGLESIPEVEFSIDRGSLEYIEYPLLVFPTFSLTLGLHKIFVAGEIFLICGDSQIRLMSIMYEKCKSAPNCCNLPVMWSFKSGVAQELITLSLTILFCWILLFVIDYYSFHKSGRRCKKIPNDDYDKAFIDHELHHASSESHLIDDSVVYERIKVQTLHPRDFWDKAIICDRVGKDYGKTSALHRLSLVIDRGECISLLGTSGCGMSTFFQILTGAVRMSYGNAFVACRSLKKRECSDLSKFVGYCAQQMPLMNEYTARDVLSIFCLIRGVPKTHLKEVCESISEMLGFYESLNVTCQKMSDGNKRRLCWGIAMAGNPTILYFDHPMVSVDPTGERQFRTIIADLCKRSNTVVIATGNAMLAHSISSRVGVSFMGKLLCIGNPNELIEKHLDGYYVRAKIRHNSFRTATGSILYRRTRSEDPMTKYIRFVGKNFPNAKLLDFEGDIVVFVIPSENTKMSTIIKKIEDNSYLLMVEFFVVARGCLETFFLNYVSRSRQLLRQSELQPRS